MKLFWLLGGLSNLNTLRDGATQERPSVHSISDKISWQRSEHLELGIGPAVGTTMQLGAIKVFPVRRCCQLCIFSTHSQPIYPENGNCVWSVELVKQPEPGEFWMGPPPTGCIRRGVAVPKVKGALFIFEEWIDSSPNWRCCSPNHFLARKMSASILYCRNGRYSCKLRSLITQKDASGLRLYAAEFWSQ